MQPIPQKYDACMYACFLIDNQRKGLIVPIEMEIGQNEPHELSVMNQVTTLYSIQVYNILNISGFSLDQSKLLVISRILCKIHNLREKSHSISRS